MQSSNLQPQDQDLRQDHEGWCFTDGATPAPPGGVLFGKLKKYSSLFEVVELELSMPCNGKNQSLYMTFVRLTLMSCKPFLLIRMLKHSVIYYLVLSESLQ